MVSSKSKILLDPVDFMALHLSALAFGGVGRGEWVDRSLNCPVCIHGHAVSVVGNDDLLNNLQSEVTDRLRTAGLSIGANDRTLAAAGVRSYDEKPMRVSFNKYIKLLNIDINPEAQS
jgi:hypothetical protein